MVRFLTIIILGSTLIPAVAAAQTPAAPQQQGETQMTTTQAPAVPASTAPTIPSPVMPTPVMPEGAAAVISGVDQNGAPVTATIPAPAGTAATEATAAPGTASTPQGIEGEINEQIAFQKPGVDINQMKSLFFSQWEHDNIVTARLGLNNASTTGNAGGDPVSSIREISLEGIVYSSAKKWTIYLNNQRVMPDAVPSPVMNLDVFKDYIDLQWFDAQTNQIFPVRLRPHQRFNFDTRMFLPGAAAVSAEPKP